MPSILFVCTANVCRSPMAEALFRHLLTQAGSESDWRVESAGTWAQDGVPISRRAQIALKLWGIDMHEHRARGVSYDLMRTFDLILVMEQNHRQALQVEFPDIAHRIIRLSEMAGSTFDIPDPMSGTQADVSEVAQAIHQILVRGFNRISMLATQA